MATTSTTSGSMEKTFSSFDKEQGKAYAQARRDYHPSVYAAVIEQHRSSSGQPGTLLDVGCGPGNAARGLATHFAHAIGLDPSEGMISVARALGGVTSTGEPVGFEVATAEELGSNLAAPIADSSVDLISAGNAAHWFDMPRFWRRAARVLRPGGSVALWTSGEIRTHPSMPAAAAVQVAIDEYEEKHLRPYYEPGNLLVRSGYEGLPLPWTMEDPLDEFERESFFSRWWEVDEDFFVGQPEVDLATVEKMMGTASAQVRWNQAHPNDVGTERDILKILLKEIARLQQEAGVEKGKERVKGAVRGRLLVVKKRA